jgi:hypothetical protein
MGAIQNFEDMLIAPERFVFPTLSLSHRHTERDRRHKHAHTPTQTNKSKMTVATDKLVYDTSPAKTDSFKPVDQFLLFF